VPVFFVVILVIILVVGIVLVVVVLEYPIVETIAVLQVHFIQQSPNMNVNMPTQAPMEEAITGSQDDHGDVNFSETHLNDHQPANCIASVQQPACHPQPSTCLASVQQPARAPEAPQSLPETTSTSLSIPSPGMKAKAPQAHRYYQRQDMAIFDLLAHPIWVFDFEKQAMWWANTAALELWNASSLDELLSRSYADDMSKVSSRRLKDYMERFHQGERGILDECTYYPSGTTMNLTLSGIHITDEEHGQRLAMLNEGDLSSVIERIDRKSVRGVEMLRHLQVAVSQFDIHGELMEQNLEALEWFGSCDDNEDVSSGEQTQQDHEQEQEQDHNCFLCRFVDQSLARRALAQVQAGQDYCCEAQQTTKQGPQWSAVVVHRSKDPVTEEPVILYSARDITDVVLARNEADRANMEKDEFMAVMGHEIRTPLHQVVGFVDMLSGTELTTEQTGFVRLLESSSSALMCVINDLLDYSKLEAGKMNIENISFEPKSVIEGALAVVRPSIEEKGLSLNSDLSSITSGLVLNSNESSITNDPIKLMGDPNRLRQILLNLLGNAVKFTHQGGVAVAVSTKPFKCNQGDSNDEIQSPEDERICLRIVVADTGLGISPENCSHVFRKYRQADASVARSYGGTGLGLSICKSLCEAMGGSIGVDSGLGEGSAFWFELPFALSTKIAMGMATDLPDASVASKALNVLVAEDNVVNQKLVAAMLKRLGHGVSIVDNGKLAVEAAEKMCTPADGIRTGETFDVVLMDVEMPILDGIAATLQIRRMGWSLSELPVIGLTANFRRNELGKYEGIGMNDCLGKPLRLKDLQVTLDRCTPC
jgi:signal transduction histidine kinase/CheY-like chemotaxis protein